jgi:peroxiredoxin
MFCREQAAQLHGENKQIEARGARLVFVGNGSTLMAQDFREQFAIQAPLYVDPSLATYRALGLHARGSLLKAMKAVPRALFAGHRQGLIKGDAMQLGGVFVVAQDGRVLFEQRSETAGDHADPRAILDALREP